MKSKILALYTRMKPFIAVSFLQTGFAGMDILSKAALNDGMNSYVLVVYRHAVAFLVLAPFAITLDRKVRPKMTIQLFIRIVALSILEPVITQNLFFLGMKYTTATFTASMVNILPAITFIMAWILRLEKVRLKSIRSQAKIIGTLATVGGAMVMTLVKGPVIELAWTKGSTNDDAGGEEIHHDWIKGSLLLTVSRFSCACFMVLQAMTLEMYPAELSLAAWICLLGTIECTVVTLVMEGGKASIWSLGWNTNMLAVFYGGIFCSGLAYYIQGIVMRDRGPVFVTAFSPLCMVIVAVMGSFILGELLNVGRVVGAVVIVAGLYLVIWGKSKDHKLSSPTDEKSEGIEQVEGIDNVTREECNHLAVNVNNPGKETVNEDEHLSDINNPSGS